MSAVTLPSSSENIVQPQSCCDRVVKALGRCWTWIVNAGRWCMDKAFQGMNAVAFGFFRVVDCFSPSLSRKMETGYLYLANWYTGHTAAVQKEIADTTITDLKEVSRKTTQELTEKSGELVVLQVDHKNATEEVRLLKKERNRDIRAVESMKSECELSQQKEEVLTSRIEVLAEENVRLRKEIQETTLEKTSAEGDKTHLTDENNGLEIENKLLSMRVKSAEKERDFALKSVWALEYLQGLSKQQGVGRCQRG
jgi:hypothetical protein